MSLPFGSSQRSTIGVEWELQLVDRDSHDLRQSADAIIDRATTDGKLYPGVHREMLLNTIEVVSKPRSTVAECMADLMDCVDYLTPLASDLRIDLATAGTHPFARPGRQRVTDSERYAQLVERTAYWGHQMLLYGVHVHVGVEDRAKILPIQAALTAHLGHLQAISASSPFWAGQDTGYASNRAMVFQQLPTAGIPRQFETWEDLEAYTDDMISTGVIEGFDEVRWDIRPSPAFGTIENRVFDAATNATEELAKKNAHPVATENPDGSVTIRYTYGLGTKPDAQCELTYTVHPCGQVDVRLDYDPVAELGDMPEFGVMFKFDADYDNVTWYGMGPEETYVDRCEGAKLGIYRNKVEDNMAKYMVPQECGNKVGVRWASVTDRKGRGMLFTGDAMEFSALPYTPHEMENAMHPFELPQVHYTVVRVSKQQMGIAGDDSWGAKPLPEYLIKTDEKMEFTFTFKGI